MSYIKLIKSVDDHEKALSRLMTLMDIDPEADTNESNELDVLALLIEKYEQERFPIDAPNPIEAIKFRMDQQGLIKKDLVPYFGSASKVTEVLNGTRNLSINMIRKLSVGLNISAEILIQEPCQINAASKDINWNAFPLAEMRLRGYFEGFKGGLRELKEYSAETMSQFLSSVNNGFDLEPAMLRTSAHLRSNNKETDGYALWAWQVRVLQKANEEKLEINYIKGAVDSKWMRKLAEMSWSKHGPSLAKEYLNSYGIHLVIEPHLPKTYLDGALCISSNGNPVIALTLRHDKLDSFWFSLMHELAHLALHVDRTETWFLDDLDAEGGDEIEQEADALAQDSLIPSADLVIQEINDVVSVRALASKLSISPCIIAGRVRYELSKHTMFGTAFRDKVKPHFSV